MDRASYRWAAPDLVAEVARLRLALVEERARGDWFAARAARLALPPPTPAEWEGQREEARAALAAERLLPPSAAVAPSRSRVRKRR